MLYYSTLYALLSSIWNTKVRGGRIKRFLTLLLSFFVVVGTLYILHKWSHITTSKHVFIVDHPMTKHISDSLYTMLDIRIKSNEGYTLQQRNSDLYLFERAFRIKQLKKEKNNITSIPAETNPQFVNIALNQEIFVDSADFINTFPQKDAENLILIGHYYNANTTSMFDKIPERRMIKTETTDEKRGSIRSFCFCYVNDSNSLALPLANKYNQKLCNDSTAFASNFFMDWYYLVYSSFIEPFSFSALNHGKSEKFDVWSLFKPYDISKKRYEIYLYSKSVDEIDIKLEANENVEISSSWNKSVKGSNFITINFKGDHYNDHHGASYVELYFRNLESENAQLIRMFIAMTFCSLALGYSIKSIFDYIWILIRKIEKRKICNEKDNK